MFALTESQALPGWLSGAPRAPRRISAKRAPRCWWRPAATWPPRAPRRARSDACASPGRPAARHQCHLTSSPGAIQKAKAALHDNLSPADTRQLECVLAARAYGRPAARAATGLQAARAGSRLTPPINSAASMPARARIQCPAGRASATDWHPSIGGQKRAPPPWRLVAPGGLARGGCRISAARPAQVVPN